MTIFLCGVEDIGPDTEEFWNQFHDGADRDEWLPEDEDDDEW